MSSKKLGGMDRKLTSKHFKTGGVGGNEFTDLFRASVGDPTAMLNPEVTDQRAGSGGTSSAARDERLATEGAAADVLAKQQATQAEAAAKQKEIDDRLSQEEEARKKLRSAATGGFASTMLSGPTGLTSQGAAGRRLYGS